MFDRNGRIFFLPPFTMFNIGVSVFSFTKVIQFRLLITLANKKKNGSLRVIKKNFILLFFSTTSFHWFFSFIQFIFFYENGIIFHYIQFTIENLSMFGKKKCFVVYNEICNTFVCIWFCNSINENEIKLIQF